MHRPRSWIVFIATMVTMAFANVASAAPQKQWSITIAPATLASATNAKVTITIKNETPNGNSNINSLQLMLPAGYSVGAAPAGAPVTTTYVGQLAWTSGVISFSNMSPLKPQSSFTMTAYLDVDTASVGCTGGDWSRSMAWTGSSFSGDTFLLTRSTVTGVTQNKALTFGSVTTPVPVGTNVSGSVQATSCGAASGVPVSLTMTNNAAGGGGGGSTSSTTNTSGIAAFQFATTVAGTFTISASANQYTTISTQVVVCGNGLSFSTSPTNVALGDSISVTVSASSCGQPASGVPVTIQDANGNVLGSGTTGSDGNVTITIPTGAGQIIATTGTFTLTASSTSTGYAPITSTVSVFGGVLNCEPTPPFNFGSDNGITDSSQSGYAAGSRGFWNKDGMSCDPLLYTFTNTILTDDIVHLAWDTSGGQHPAFTYTMTWRTEDVDNASNPDSIGATNYGYPVPRRASVAWTLNGSGSPAFVPALACLDTKLPAPYASLNGTISDTQTTIIVNTPPTVPTYTDPSDNTTKSYPTSTVPSTVPFSIVIGTERMLVTATSGNTWTVTRGYAGTTKAVHGGSGSTVYVMSTPLPIDLNTGIQVPMCVVNHGWMAAGFNPITGVAQVRYFTTVFDIGDGWVRGF